MDRQTSMPSPSDWVGWLGERDAQVLLLWLMQAIEQGTPLQTLRLMVEGWRAKAHEALTANDYRARVDHFLEVSVDARLWVLARPEQLDHDVRPEEPA